LFKSVEENREYLRQWLPWLDATSQLKDSQAWLAEKMMGQGIVTSCVAFLTSYAFDELDLNKVCIPAAEKNAPSRAIPERLNFVNEGIEREAELLYDRYVNHVRYSLLREERDSR